jgi:hypothetical protein
VIGDITGLNTSSFTDGDQLYLSGTVAGEYTTTKTLAPTHLVYIGKVTRSHPTLGQIEVQIQNGYELDEIHDVAISTPTNDQILTYETSSGLWKNKVNPKIGVTTVTPVTLTSGSWSLVSGLYEYTYTSAAIFDTSIVDVIPKNASISIVKAAEILPATESFFGYVKIYATNAPTGNIIVTFNIYN